MNLRPSWTFFQNVDNLIKWLPARRALEFSAKRRAIIFLLIFQSLNSQAIPGFCEPWSECQPEESRNDADGDGGEPTTAMPHSHQQAPRTGIKYPVQGRPPHSDMNKQKIGLLSIFFLWFVDGKANLLSIKKKQIYVILSRRDGSDYAYQRSRFRDRILEVGHNIYYMP
jgi:hypothetical protein